MSSRTPEWLGALLSEFVVLLRDDEMFRALAYTTVLVAPQASGDSHLKHEALDAWRDQIVASLNVRADSSISPGTVAGLVLVLIHGFTVTAVTRPQDFPQPEHLDAAIAAVVTGLLS